MSDKPNARLPHEVMLTVDVASGQNALSQIKHCKNIINAGSLCVTKLDGAAKGGIIAASTQELGLCIRFIGVGESMKALHLFVAMSFTRALQAEQLSVANPSTAS